MPRWMSTLVTAATIQPARTNDLRRCDQGARRSPAPPRVSVQHPRRLHRMLDAPSGSPRLEATCTGGRLHQVSWRPAGAAGPTRSRIIGVFHSSCPSRRDSVHQAQWVVAGHDASLPQHRGCLVKCVPDVRADPPPTVRARPFSAEVLGIAGTRIFENAADRQLDLLWGNTRHFAARRIGRSRDTYGHFSAHARQPLAAHHEAPNAPRLLDGLIERLADELSGALKSPSFPNSAQNVLSVDRRMLLHDVAYLSDNDRSGHLVVEFPAGLKNERDPRFFVLRRPSWQRVKVDLRVAHLRRFVTILRSVVGSRSGGSR